MKLEAFIADVQIADEVKVGDRVKFQAVGVVHKVEDEVIDITRIGGPPETIPGDRTVSLLLDMATVDVVEA